MQILIACLSLVFADETIFIPNSPPEVGAIVEKMGSRSYHEREDACKELQMLGWTALKAVSEARKSSNPEIQWRAEKVYESYFRFHEEPSIWYINEKLRFPNGFELEFSKHEAMSSVCKEFPKDLPDIARDFYDIAYRKMGRQNIFHTYRDGCEYHNPKVSEYAMYLYTRSLLIQGKPRQEVQKIVTEARRNTKKYWHFYQSDNLDNLNYDWELKPPGPMILKKDFVEPTHPYGGIRH